MTAARQRLPNRRASEKYNLACGGLAYAETVSRFSEGSIAKVCLSNHKRGSAADTNARDAAIDLQHCSSAWRGRRSDPESVLQGLPRPPKRAAQRRLEFDLRGLAAAMTIHLRSTVAIEARGTCGVTTFVRRVDLQISLSLKTQQVAAR
jgi:hypothetical protein